jgi:molybdate transport system substrate-binding protein
VSSRTRAALTALLLLVASGCAGGRTGTADGSPESGTLTVLAASSLAEAFTGLKKQFEADHPGVTVRLAFDSSATLAEQVNQGAPADVLATADERTMRSVADAGGIDGAAKTFATNRLAMVVPADNPARLTSLQDLDTPGVSYVVCVPTAPCGALARTQLDEHRIAAKPRSEEVDVKAVLSKVELDEADAGLVYVTDAIGAGDKVRRIDIPGSGASLNRYPIASLSGAAKPGLAHAWVDLVLSDRGRQVLTQAGFGKP